MGDNSSEISRVGNFILGRDAFDTEAPPPSVEQHSERAGGTVEGRYITLINTPHLLLSKHSLDHTQIRESLYLCAPGPHLFLLVLQNRTMKKEDQDRIEKSLDSYSPWIMKFTIVLTPDEDVNYRAAAQAQLGTNPSLRVVIGNSEGDRKVQVLRLLEKIEQVVRSNGGGYLTYDTNDLLKKAKRKPSIKQRDLSLTSRKHVRMVLLGKNSSEISRVGNFILGRDVFDTEAPPPSVEQHSERAGGTVEGRYITLINTPHLFHPQLTLDQITVQIKECMALCSPGPHVFVLVLQPDGCTSRDREQIRTILNSFSDTAFKHTTVITQTPDGGSDPHELNQLLQEVQKGGGQHFHMDTSDRSDLLKAVEKMVQKNKKGYVKYRVMEESPHEKDQKKLELGDRLVYLTPSIIPENKAYFSRAVRIILLGRTAAGKSATGNTILGREDVFKEGVFGKTVTEKCQRETGEINGRQITVVDTPGLFDADSRTDYARNKITESITMVTPGPHVFLLVVPIERYNLRTNKTTNMILNALGEDCRTYTMVLFTKGDSLRDNSIEQFVENSGQDTKELIRRCEGRYHVFNNRNHGDRTQVTALLEKIDSMMAANEGSCYTKEMFQKVKKEKQDEEQDEEMKIMMENIEKQKEQQRLWYQRLSVKHNEDPEKIKHEDEEMEIMMENIEEQRYQQWLWYQRRILKRDVQPDDYEKIRGKDADSGETANNPHQV